VRGRARVCGLLVFAGMVASLGACGGEDAGQSATSGKIAVTATDTECTLERTQAKAGTVTFAVSNKGTKVTEFYVYAPGDRVMAEVEDIAPGVSRDLTVQLPEGTYETACKPGMSGRGIRGAFSVTAG